jgi:hypothetical protein
MQPHIRSDIRIARWSVAALAMTIATSAWALCSDGSTFPGGGYVIGQAPVQTAANWSPNVFTGTAGSIWIPDNSVYEFNDPTKGTLTNGGHNWVFDQGSTLCKEQYTGPAGGQPTGWAIPPNTPTDCVVLPILKGGRVTNLGDIPYQGQAVTPTCNPAILASPANTYANQLGCAISQYINGTAIATDAHSAPSFLFVAGIKGGLFAVQLSNAPATSGNAGKTAGPQFYYSDIPEGQKLTNAAVSPDGQYAMATSIRRAQYVYACQNPLGDPGDPTKPLPATFALFHNADGSNPKCMQVGNNNLQVDLTTSFGPEGQPYFGGQRVVNSFNSQPGGTAPSAWPQCITQGTNFTITQAFANHSAGHCGNALPNFGFTSALVTQPQALISHVAANGDMYMYTGPLGGTVLQFKVTKDANGVSTYKFRTYLTGVSLTTGLGVEDGTHNLMVFTDPSAVGLAGQEVVTKLPLCEDM